MCFLLQGDDDDDEDDIGYPSHCSEGDAASLHSHSGKPEASRPANGAPPSPNPWRRTGSRKTRITHDEYHHFCDTTLECKCYNISCLLFVIVVSVLCCFISLLTVRTSVKVYVQLTHRFRTSFYSNALKTLSHLILILHHLSTKKKQFNKKFSKYS